MDRTEPDAAIRKALRNLLAGLPRTIREEDVNGKPLPTDWTGRDPSLPDLGPDAGFLLGGGNPELVRKAVHEAGHAMVALDLGLELTSIERDEPEAGADGSSVTRYGCTMGGHPKADWACVDAAGLLSEMLVWGRDAYWFGAIFDLVEMARRDKAERLGGIRHAVARGWRATRLPAPASLDLSVSKGDVIQARDDIPDRALDAAIEALPRTLRVAALVHAAWSAGEGVVPVRDIMGALEEPWDAPRP